MKKASCQTKQNNFSLYIMGNICVKNKLDRLILSHGYLFMSRTIAIDGRGKFAAQIFLRLFATKVVSEMEIRMKINEYQELAMTTLNPELSKRDVLINSVMGLCGESGEAIDIVKKVDGSRT